jgi:hypothetical protein
MSSKVVGLTSFPVPLWPRGHISCLENVGRSTSHISVGLNGLLTVNLFICYQLKRRRRGGGEAQH